MKKILLLLSLFSIYNIVLPSNPKFKKIALKQIGVNKLLSKLYIAYRDGLPQIEALDGGLHPLFVMKPAQEYYQQCKDSSPKTLRQMAQQTGKETYQDMQESKHSFAQAQQIKDMPDKAVEFQTFMDKHYHSEIEILTGVRRLILLNTLAKIKETPYCK